MPLCVVLTGAGKVQGQGSPANWVPGEGSLPGLRSLAFHCVCIHIPERVGEPWRLLVMAPAHLPHQITHPAITSGVSTGPGCKYVLGVRPPYLFSGDTHIPIIIHMYMCTHVI